MRTAGKNRQFVPSTGRGTSRPKHLSGVLGKVVRSLGLSSNYNGWSVVTQWPQIVGPSIAREAKAVSFKDGTLFVAVRDSAWRQELAMRQDELLEKIHRLPHGQPVKQIRLVQGMKGSEEYGDESG